MTNLRVRLGSICQICSSFAKSYSAVPDQQEIEDQTSTNLVNLRRVIYLTIMNALNYEEAVHKLLKVQLEEGQEVMAFIINSNEFH